MQIVVAVVHDAVQLLWRAKAADGDVQLFDALAAAHVTRSGCRGFARILSPRRTSVAVDAVIFIVPE